MPGAVPARFPSEGTFFMPYAQRGRTPPGPVNRHRDGQLNLHLLRGPVRFRHQVRQGYPRIPSGTRRLPRPTGGIDGIEGILAARMDSQHCPRCAMIAVDWF